MADARTRRFFWYSAATVDPMDDCTFFHTNEYLKDDELFQLVYSDRELQVPDVFLPLGAKIRSPN